MSFCYFELFADRPGIMDTVQVQTLQGLILQGLQQEIMANHQSEPALFAQLLLLASTLRDLSTEHKKILASSHQAADLGAELNEEVFGLVIS